MMHICKCTTIPYDIFTISADDWSWCSNASSSFIVASNVWERTGKLRSIANGIESMSSSICHDFEDNNLNEIRRRGRRSESKTETKRQLIKKVEVLLCHKRFVTHKRKINIIEFAEIETLYFLSKSDNKNKI